MANQRFGLRGNSLLAVLWFGIAAAACLSEGDALAQPAGDPPSAQRPDGGLPKGPGIPPVKVERREITDGAYDPRRRAVLNLGGFREGCPPWRFELSGKEDGTAVFQVIEPADRRIILGSDV